MIIKFTKRLLYSVQPKVGLFCVWQGLYVGVRISRDDTSDSTKFLIAL